MIEYVGVLLFLVVGALFVSVTLVASSLVRPSKVTREKIMPYECGENPIGTPWGVRFNIRFYVFALVFLIFDVEAVMLLPWAVAFKSAGMIAFVAGMIFIGMLVLGLADVWRKGDLEWVREEDREAARAGTKSSSAKAA
jgi:NADH-quinone oxidoreductase subunit A